MQVLECGLKGMLCKGSGRVGDGHGDGWQVGGGVVRGARLQGKMILNGCESCGRRDGGEGTRPVVAVVVDGD